MKTHESKTCLVLAYHHVAITILQQLSSCNNYGHAIATIFATSIVMHILSSTNLNANPQSPTNLQ